MNGTSSFADPDVFGHLDPDPDPVVQGTNPNPSSAPDPSKIKQKL